MAILNIGDKIGQYTVSNLIKSNAYTETYRIEDLNNCPYFMKVFVLKNIPLQLIDHETNIVKEIQYSKLINHKNIISCIESGAFEKDISSCQYYITNYFQGSILADIITREHSLREEEATRIFKGILDALKYLHSLNPILCHNDIDVSNIIISETNNKEPEIIDLGHLSERSYGSVWFDTTDIDPLYHANETRVSIFDEQSDIFSACCVLYTMLAGKTPWEIKLPLQGSYKEKFGELDQFRKSHKVDYSNFAISEKLLHVLRKGLELKNTERYKSVDEIIADLDSSRVKNQSSESYTEEFQSQSSEQVHHQSPNYVEFQIKKGNGKGFEDIAGMSELKDLLNKQVVFVIKNKDVAEEYKITPPNGMLLYGPPGCGKTFFAEKFAEETEFSYLLVKSSDLASSYVHGSQEKIRQLFDQAEKKSPIVICFDEFDALVPDRSWNNVSSEEVNEFLSQMNNCSKRGIFIVATSNRPDKIDPAVLRTGRIDKMVYVPLPDFEARKEMFAIHLKGRPQDDSIDLDELAKKTEGYIASDIAYIVNDSAMVAAFTRTKITGNHLCNSIQNTRPSVRTDVMKTYEDIRKKMEDNNRRNIGERGKIVAW